MNGVPMVTFEWTFDMSATAFLLQVIGTAFKVLFWYGQWRGWWSRSDASTCPAGTAGLPPAAPPGGGFTPAGGRHQSSDSRANPHPASSSSTTRKSSSRCSVSRARQRA